MPRKFASLLQCVEDSCITPQQYWLLFELCRSVYFAICVCCFLHNLAFYYLTRLSAVMAGINKAVQAVSVFAFSHLCYCDIDAQQCLTSGKIVAMALVVLGVLLFSFGAPLFSLIASHCVDSILVLVMRFVRDGDPGKQWGHKSPAVNIGMGNLDASVDEADGFRISDVQEYKRFSVVRDWTPEPSTVDQTSFAGARNEQVSAEKEDEASTLQSVNSKEQGLMAMKSAQ